MKKGLVPKIFLIVIIVLVVIIGGGITALYLLFPPQKVVALILPQAEKATGRAITVNGASFSFFPSIGLSLSGVEISNTAREGFSKQPFVNIGNFTASVSVLSIFKGSPEITSIVLRKPALLIEVNEQGSFNYDDITKTAAAAAVQQSTPGAMAGGRSLPAGLPPLPLPITLRKLVIEEGSLVYDDRKAGMRAVVGRIDQEAELSIDKALRNAATSGTIRLSGMSLSMKGMDVPLSRLALTVTHDLSADFESGAVTVHLVKATVGKIALGVKGTMTDALTPRPQLDLQLVAEPIALGDLMDLASLELPPGTPKATAAGTMEVGGYIKGVMLPNAPLPISGFLKVKDAEVKFAGLPRSISGLNADIAFTGNSLSIITLTARFGKSPIDIKAVVTDFAKPFVDAVLKADIDLGDAKDVIKLPAGASLGGRVTADIKVDGLADPADPGKLFCTGGVDLFGVTILWPPLVVPAVMNGRVTLSKESLAEKIGITIGPSSLATSATIAHYLALIAPPGAKVPHRADIDCMITSPFLDIDKIMNPAQPAGRAGGVAPATPGAPAAVAPPEMLLPAPLSMADLHAVFTAKKINYKGFAMGDVSAKIGSIGSRADVGFASTFSTGSIGNTLHVDLANPKAVSFADKFFVKNVELNDLMARFGDIIKPVTPLNKQLLRINKGLFGRINVDGALQGRGATPEQITQSLAGTVKIHMTDGKLENTPFQTAASEAISAYLKTDKIGGFNPITFKELSASTRIADSRATIDELKILSDLGDWNAKGVVGFDAVMDMAVSTRLSKAVSDRILAVEGSAKGIVKNALQGTQFAAAAGLLDNVSLIPHDNEGRISLKFGLAGQVNAPKLSSLGFGQVGGRAGQPAPARQPGSIKQNAQEQLQKAGEKLKNQLQELFK